MKRKFVLIVGLLVWGSCTTSRGQVKAIPNHELIGFTNHLIKFGLLEPAEELASSHLNRAGLSMTQKDSLLFLVATAQSELKKDSLAEISYAQVSEESGLYMQAQFLAVKKCIERQQFAKAYDRVSSLPLTDNEETNEIRKFLETGTGLLSGKKMVLDEKDPALVLKNPLLQKEIIHLRNLSIRKQTLKKRSPWIAGALSALVPGLGKVYAGSNAQGLATFLRVALLGGLATENYLRHGFKNPQFWFLGGVAGVYYVSGIYGSVYLPKLNHQEKLDAIQQDAKVGLLTPY